MGVTIIAKHVLDTSEIDLHTNADIVVASFNCKDLKKPIIVVAYTDLQINNLDYSQELCTVVNDLHARFRDHILWIGGDANLSRLHW